MPTWTMKLDDDLARTAIEAALDAAWVTGVNYPETLYEGGVSVNLMSTVAARIGTPWQISGVSPK